jgi:hypothetical protein
LLRQLGNGQFHGAFDWDASDAFVLIDPAVSGQSLCRLLARGFQKLAAFFRSRLLVIASTRRGPNYGEHDHTEKCKEEYDPKPRGQRGPRVDNLTKRFGFGHFS